MSNDELQMTNQLRMSKHEKGATTILGHLSFVLRHCFDI